MLRFYRFIFCATLLSIGSADDAKLNNKKFPKNFLFGASTSAFQIEGAWNLDGKTESTCDKTFNKQPSIVIDGSDATVACDSYHKYKEDVAILRELGVDHYRFSLAWTRILPTGYANEINEAGVKYYKDLIRELKINQIQPIVTLYHYDLPQSLQDKGGFSNPLFPEWFANYSRVCFELFGDDVSYWLTINEPYPICSMGSLSGPFVEGIDTYICALRYLTAHAAIWHVYDTEFRSKQKGRVAMVLNGEWAEPASNTTDDITAAETRMQFMWGIFAHPLYYGDWPEIMKTRIAMRSKLEGFNQSRLPEMTQEEINYIKGTNDFFALNSYTTVLVKAIQEPEISSPNSTKDIGVFAYQRDDWLSSSASWLKFVPWGMRKLLKWIKDEYFSPNIIITENGWADSTDQLDDKVRESYIKEYLSNIRDAMDEDGVNVKAYSVWSLMDNFEWVSGYTAKFGITYVDFNSPNRTRTRKNSSYYYEKVCKTHCLVEKCED
nr:myrosinase 1-like [Leptinotarsa decemlineata]